MRTIPLLLVVLSIGCSSASHEPAPAPELPRDHTAPAAEPLGDRPSGEPRVFGSPLDEALAPTELAAIESDPARFRDQVVRTRGTVVRVCQAMGCWMELAADGTEAVRVPMAGHAFFLPRDAAGRPAEIQGTVRLAELSAAMREHLAREGAVATGGTLAIEASSVVLR